jgi:uncharacterized membrane protein
VSFISSLSRPVVLGSLLAVSVAGNMFLGGMLAGRFGGHAMHPPMIERDFESRLHFVPEAQRRAMRDQMRKDVPAMRKHWRRMHHLRESLAKELARETPDRATVEKQLAALRAESSAMQETLHRGFVDTVLKLAPDERKRMLDAMLIERGPGGPRHGPGPGGPGPGSPGPRAGGSMPPPPPPPPAEPPPAPE